MTQRRAPDVRLTLGVDPEADPIAGSIASGQGCRERFGGWLELMAAVERMLTCAPPDCRAEGERHEGPR